MADRVALGRLGPVVLGIDRRSYSAENTETNYGSPLTL
jgi:hypothetical protein